ncbi:DUF1990 family protein [Calidithermus chliarophilus]|uniref:DUF1990 family protein n=1 Tax=Calidithermus chliarophilus TaxID=52023 RepID=UPI000417C6F6|nr:DUF1990 family protein [Calidithermus chliarophilus]
MVGGKEAQPARDGTGALFHRRYQVRFSDARMAPRELMAFVKANLASLAPAQLADFEKRHGHPWVMKVGDEYDITIFGPWNGAVRVVEVGETSFTLLTLKGHPEAGHIRFTLEEDPEMPGVLCFCIESWARSRDGLVQLAYSSLKLGQMVQERVWVTFCKRVVKYSGGRQLGKVEVVTEELGRG